MFLSYIRWCLAFLLFTSSFLSPLTIKAQSLRIIKVSLIPNDSSAEISPVLDINGDTCALIKIVGEGLETLSFPNANQYVKSSYHDEVHYVYMPTSLRRLDCYHPDCLPVTIDMGEYGFRKLRGGKTYVVSMVAEGVNHQGKVILKLIPADAVVTVDQERYEANSSLGVLEIPVDKGIHKFDFSAEGFFSQNKFITINGTETQSFTIKLEPITYPINITTNVPAAKVYIDGDYYGTASQRLWVSGGKHTLRLQAKGYKDREIDVTITDSNNNYDIQLAHGKNTKILTPQPVYVGWILDGDVYVNKRKVERQGNYIYLMPGKYMISDKYDSDRRKIEVQENTYRILP